jgi:hypothetical protein
MIRDGEKNIYYYNLMTKCVQEEWLIEFMAYNSGDHNHDLEKFFGMCSGDFEDFIASSFNWNTTRSGVKRWESYARTNADDIVSLKREEGFKELGI